MQAPVNFKLHHKSAGIPNFRFQSQPSVQKKNNSNLFFQKKTYNHPTFSTIFVIIFYGLLGYVSGGHANVYKADWSRSFGMGTSSIIVAVKQLHTDLGEVYRNRERLTMLTDHPNLVKCMDSTLEPPYLIITEFLAGGSLFDLLYNSEQEMSLWQQLKILWDIASGMGYLHDQKPCILHRDAWKVEAVF